MMESGKIVLLVQEDKNLRDMIQFQLSRRGYHVVTAHDGYEGLAWLKEIRPDLILLDSDIAPVSSMEFYDAITDPYGRTAFPVFALTARMHLQRIFKEMNICGFLTKPFDVDRLIEEVLSLIESGGPCAPEISKPKEMTKICIVDNDRNFLSELSSSLVDEGYIVFSALSAVAGIERIISHRPDIGIIKLELDDIPGHTLIARLKQIEKTKNLRFILYRQPAEEGAEAPFFNKDHVLAFLETRHHYQILDTVNRIWAQDV